MSINSYMALGRQYWRFHQKEVKSDLRRNFLTKPYWSGPREEVADFLPGPRAPGIGGMLTGDNAFLQLFLL